MSRPSIYVIGDSISFQYGPYLERALGRACEYARREGDEEARLNFDIPLGANSGDSRMVRRFLEARAEDRSPVHDELLLVNCGLHDIKADEHTGALAIAVDEYRTNLEAIIVLARTMADTFVWISTTPVDDELHARRKCGFDRFQKDVESYNAAADEVMREAVVPILDLHRFTASLVEEGAAYTDGVHFEPEIQAQQGAFIAGWVLGWLMC